MTDLPLHRRPVRSGASDQARRLIERATKHCRRLRDSSDAEALHDLRVGVRRLRSFIQAYREYLPFGKRALRRLRRLTRRTNALRDAEVALEWLEAQRDELTAGQRVGSDWLTEKISADKQREYEELRVEMPMAWARLETRLRKRLGPPSDEEHEPTFGEVSRRLVQEKCRRLGDRLAEVTSIDDETSAHDARIAAKRLRYLLEPFRTDLDSAKPVVRELRKFQDTFGDLNDTHLMLARLHGHLDEAAAENALDEQAGLIRLGAIARERRARLFAKMQERYLGDRAGSLLTPIDCIADQLVSAAEPG